MQALFNFLSGVNMNKPYLLYGNALLLGALVCTGCATTAKKAAALPWKAGTEGVSVVSFDMPSGTRVAVGDKSLESSFPKGFDFAAGSGLAFDGIDNNGEYVFWGITDRGPNIDSPNVGKGGKIYASKIFASPSFVPSYTKITVGADGVKFGTPVALKTGDGKNTTGLPLPAGLVGSSGEIALDVNLNELAPSADGYDTESIAFDAKDRRYIWVSDEYGPFAVKVELATGKIVKKLAPGSGLPELIAKRVPNRGAEGLAVTPNGKIYVMVQSILDDLSISSSKSKALFCRIVEYDPATGKTRQLAYPIDAGYKKQADCKLGDIAALDNTHFLIIEQGKRADKKMYNIVYKIDIAGATDITAVKASDGQELESVSSAADLAALGVRMIAKTELLDLRANGWNVEKAEGLAVIDNRTIAVSSDNDFGLVTKVMNPIDGDDDPTDYTLQDGRLYLNGKEASGTTISAVSNGESGKLWMFRFDKSF